MLLNRMDDYFAIRERAYEQLLGAGRSRRRRAGGVLVGDAAHGRGRGGRGGGWLARAARLVEEDGTDSVPAACLGLSAAFAVAVAGDLERAAALTGEVVADGLRLGSRELVGVALHQQGLQLIEAGRTDEGLAKLDEAMLELASGSLSPMATGIVYCGAIAGCWTAYELRRVHEWTAAMTRWCDSQPQLLQFTGECRVRRAELKQLHGAWTDAIAELVPRNAAADAGTTGTGWRPICGETSTGSRVGSTRPRTASPRLRGWVSTRSLVSRCCAWPAGACRRPPRCPVVAWPSARTTSSGSRSSPRPPRSCWPRARTNGRARPLTSWLRSPPGGAVRWSRQPRRRRRPRWTWRAGRHDKALAACPVSAPSVGRGPGAVPRGADQDPAGQGLPCPR